MVVVHRYKGWRFNGNGMSENGLAAPIHRLFMARKAKMICCFIDPVTVDYHTFKVIF